VLDIKIRLPSNYNLEIDWRKALDLCVDGRKKHCLLELHTLHEVKLGLEEPRRLMVLEEYIRYMPKSESLSRRWMFDIYKDQEGLAKYFSWAEYSTSAVGGYSAFGEEDDPP
jgi:hypothetical protein